MASGGLPDNRGSLGGAVTAMPLCRKHGLVQLFIAGLPRTEAQALTAYAHSVGLLEADPNEAAESLDGAREALEGPRPIEP